ncbi:MAG: GDSL-type esterase/lipase family protein [Pirellulales bacterium]
MLEATAVFLIAVFVLVGSCAAVFGLFLVWRHAKRWFVLPLLSLFAFIGCTGAVFICGEFYYRFVYEGTDSIAGNATHQAWLAQHWHTNNWGIRDSVDYVAAAPPDKVRLTFLGDSTLAGAGIPDVSQRFANRIRRRRGNQWDVQVFGVPGAATKQEMALLARLFAERPYETDVVILHYDANDIAELSPEFMAWWQAGEEQQQRLHDNVLIRHSRFLEQVLSHAAMTASLDLETYQRLIESAFRGPAWQEQVAQLRMLREFCDAHGARLVILYKSCDAPRIKEFSDESGVAALDLCPSEVGHTEQELVVSDTDRHASALAHGLFADAIEEFLTPLATRGPRRPVDGQLQKLADFLAQNRGAE